MAEAGGTLYAPDFNLIPKRDYAIRHEVGEQLSESLAFISPGFEGLQPDDLALQNYDNLTWLGKKGITEAPTLIEDYRTITTETPLGRKYPGSLYPVAFTYAVERELAKQPGHRDEAREKLFAQRASLAEAVSMVSATMLLCRGLEHGSVEHVTSIKVCLVNVYHLLQENRAVYLLRDLIHDLQIQF